MRFIRFMVVPLLVVLLASAFAQTKPESKAPVKAEKVTPEQVKDLQDGLRALQVDGIAVQTAQNTFTSTDPLAKKTLELLQEQIQSSPEVKKAMAEQERDRQALLAKIAALRKQQGLDDTWDWSFSENKFIKVTTPAKK